MSNDLPRWWGWWGGEGQEGQGGGGGGGEGHLNMEHEILGN